MIKNSFVQLPAREGKNSFFFEVANLEVKINNFLETGIRQIELTSSQLQIFVAS